MKNTKRNSDFLKIKHRILNCDEMDELQSLFQLMKRYGKIHEDGKELLVYYMNKQSELNGEEINTMCEPIYRVR